MDKHFNREARIALGALKRAGIHHQTIYNWLYREPKTCYLSYRNVVANAGAMVQNEPRNKAGLD